MEKSKLYESLSGLIAYDSGSTDSGIKDEFLREEIKKYMHSLDENEFRVMVTGFIREYFVCESAVESGYGIEDVKYFIEWLSTFMEIDL